MHCKWTRKRRAWGCEVVRALEMDDPVRLIRAFRYPTELAFVDINTQVESDYGGYAWTDMMHLYSGDTALHLALKWKRHRAFKALLSLYPDWTLPNENGVTVQDLAMQVYGRGILILKEEQEREWENDAMLAEENEMRRLVSEEEAAHERARQAFLRQLHAERTTGFQREAEILKQCGRILARDDAGATDGDHYRRADSLAITASRWAAHICRELRRNRFAAHRMAMRRNEIPSRAPVSPAPRSPSSTSPLRISGGHLSGKHGEASRDVITPPRSVIGGGGSSISPQLCVGDRSRGTRAPSSPAGGRSPGSRSSLSSMMSGGCSTLQGTPKRSERPSRMVAAIKTANFLAAEKSIPRRPVTPKARLQQKMAKREASIAAQTRVQPSASRPPPPVPEQTHDHIPESSVEKRTGHDKSGESSSIVAKRSTMDTTGMLPTSAHQSNLLSRAFAAIDRVRERRLPVRHTLEALLKSTVLDPEGVRVSTSMFPQISTHHELKYSGPMDSDQAMAFASVLSARPGILIHMNICGKRLGDKGIEILAPAIPAIRSVDLRRNNIGDRGVHAIVTAWKNACLIQLETLSLAGNRVGDSGANALSSMLEDGGDAKGSSPGKTKGFLRWLSLAGNPRVSAEARERLLQAAANKRNGSSNVPWVVVA